MEPRRLKALTELADPELRGVAAPRVAELYGAKDLMLFTNDKEVGLLLPISGFPQTLPEGIRWRRFLKRCSDAGSAKEFLPIPGSPEPQPAIGIACASGAVLVFIGGQLREYAYTEIPLILPMLHLAINGEQAARIAEASALLAAERVSVAHRLAESLDKVRSELANALVKSRAAQQELKLADLRKNEFLALLAHELRNPLAPIGNALELLRISVDKPAVITKVREIMHRQFTQMVRLIDDLMDVSRISTGKIFLKKEALELQEVLLGTIEAAKPKIAMKKQILNVELQIRAIVLGDPIRLNQVFLNILNNAATYTPEGGEITVTASEATEHIDVMISDTGKGVPSEIASTIFNMFAQGDDTTSRASGGLGIGLALTKTLLELHDGSVSVFSQGRDMGSTFTVRLPLYKGSATKTEPVKHSTHPHQIQLRILVVDDNEDSATTLGWSLGALGYECRLAFDGKTALRLAESFVPHVVLLDIGMPEMTGYEVCEAMRAIPSLSRSLLIAQTGWGLLQDKAKTKEAGFDYHLVKPVDIEELKGILKKYGATIQYDYS